MRSSSGTQDPRFPAVREDELKDLDYSVDVLGAPEKIGSMDELDVKRFGVIVTPPGSVEDCFCLIWKVLIHRNSR